MSYFTKIDNFFIEEDLDFLKRFKSDTIAMEFIGSGTHLEYFLLTDYPEFISIHIKKICKIEPTGILYSRISGQGSLGAHVDQGPLVSLNYYIDAGLDETIFFEKKSDNVLSKRYDNQESNIYTLQDLTPKAKFVANTQDVYLLNVNKIHAVIKKTNVPREFISYQWYNNTYEEVKENLLL